MALMLADLRFRLEPQTGRIDVIEDGHYRDEPPSYDEEAKARASAFRRKTWRESVQRRARCVVVEC
jgi:hypothetical protein